MSDYGDILKREFEKLSKDLIDKHDELGMRASGNWAESHEVEVTDTPQRITATLRANKYTEQLQYGRRPNKDQSKKSLKAFVGWAGSTFIPKWLKEKDLIMNPYAVAWGIAKKGTKYYQKGGTDLVDSVVTDERIKSITDQLGALYVEAISTGFASELKEASK